MHRMAMPDASTCGETLAAHVGIRMGWGGSRALLCIGDRINQFTYLILTIQTLVSLDFKKE